MTSPKLSIYNKKNTASLEAVFYIDCKHNIADYIGCVFACFGGDKGTRTLGLCVANTSLYQLSHIPMFVCLCLCFCVVGFYNFIPCFIVVFRLRKNHKTFQHRRFRFENAFIASLGFNVIYFTT